jgi:hypothetical protein
MYGNRPGSAGIVSRARWRAKVRFSEALPYKLFCYSEKRTILPDI